MKGITVRAGIGGSARLEEVREPDPAEGAVLVETIAVGVGEWDMCRNGRYTECGMRLDGFGRDRFRLDVYIRRWLAASAGALSRA